MVTLNAQPRGDPLEAGRSPRLTQTRSPELRLRTAGLKASVPVSSVLSTTDIAGRDEPLSNAKAELVPSGGSCVAGTQPAPGAARTHLGELFEKEDVRERDLRAAPQRGAVTDVSPPWTPGPRQFSHDSGD